LHRRHAIVIAAALVASPAFAGTGGSGPDFLDLIRTLWPVLVGLVVVTTGGVLAALTTRFVTASRFDLLRDRVDRIDAGCERREVRVVALEEAARMSPTRIELQEDIGEIGARMTGVEVGIKAIDGRLETQNQYLNMLLDRGMRGPA
jgi:hypothetical protein